MAGWGLVSRGLCSLCGFSRNLTLTEMGGGVPCDHRDRGCRGTLDVAYTGMRRGIPQELLDFVCTCDAPPLELRILSIGGSSWTVGADPKWSVRDIKEKIEHVSGVPAREQRLLHGELLLQDPQVLHQFVAAGSSALESSWAAPWAVWPGPACRRSWRRLAWRARGPGAAARGGGAHHGRTRRAAPPAGHGPGRPVRPWDAPAGPRHAGLQAGEARGAAG
mmetsp:Transcript_30893/g.91804  ORF Transcript_30893/g.91804 Transcript_30893/m.91804 type:complete len:220 (-) Transcript_30893:401-1060(-)